MENFREMQLSCLESIGENHYQSQTTGDRIFFQQDLTHH